jgi:hypothetical protein
VGRHFSTEPELYGFRKRIRRRFNTVSNRSINMFTAALNYKFGGWWY